MASIGDDATRRTAKFNERQTVEQWLEQLATTSTSDERDDRKMQNLLRRVGYPGAICTCGIVYLKGHGTPDAPPMPIQPVAKQLVNTVKGD